MPAFSYVVSDFVPFTKIVSADVNSRFNDIKVFLNTTKLDDTNIQDAGITRATKLKVGTLRAIIVNNNTTGAMSEFSPGNNKALYTGASGDLTSASALPLALGGTGSVLTPTVPGDVLQLGPGNTIIFSAPPSSVGSKVFSYQNFT